MNKKYYDSLIVLCCKREKNCFCKTKRVKELEKDHKIATKVRLWYIDVQQAQMPMSWMDKSFKACLQSKLEEILNIQEKNKNEK